jgi:hypothetical protein
MAVAGVEVVNTLGGQYDSRLFPVTGVIVNGLSQPITLIGAILVVFLAAESYWREQRVGMAAVVGASPLPAGAMLVAKLAALAALLASLVVSGIAVGLAVQLARGAAPVEAPVYLSLFAFTWAPLVVYAAAALAINAASPGKYAGMVATLAFVVLARRAQSLGLDHPLWRFGWTPPVAHTEMNGFGSGAAAFAAFQLHWTLVTALLVLGAAALWRAADAPVGVRLRSLAARPGRGRRALAAGLVAAALVSGGWIHYNTAILNDHRTAREVGD